MELPIGLVLLVLVIGVVIYIMLRRQASAESAEEIVAVPDADAVRAAIGPWAERHGYRPAESSAGVTVRYQKGTPGVTNPRFVELRSDASGSQLAAYMQMGFGGKVRRTAYTIGKQRAPKAGLAELNDLLTAVGIPSR